MMAQDTDIQAAEIEEHATDTILVVEDNKNLRSLIQKILHRVGFTTAGASDGTTALNWIADNPVALLLLDYQLPDMTSRQVIETLVQRQRDIPFIIMTGHGDERVAVKMMKLGARDYLVKDDQFLDLLTAVVNQVVAQLEIEQRLARAEEALRESEERYSRVNESIQDVIYSMDGERNLTFISGASEKLLGIPEDELLGKNFIRLAAAAGASPKKLRQIRDKYEEAVKKVQEAMDYEITLEINSVFRSFELKEKIHYNADGGITGSSGVMRDISRRKQVEEELKRYAAELERSNQELRQFAYVASHDLQEPLRMVSSYVQLLERRYKGKLDSDADDFIAYAVEGATRMHNLINDLLAYSRVSMSGKDFESTDCEAVLDNSLTNLEIAIEENGAVVTHDPLPTLIADDVQLGQLFQNLIANAIKFHGTEPPSVHISVERNAKEWLFSVRDNGIGIDQKHADRIFVIFQRLHNREEYPGTGIGLAICRNIVERHGGRIWVESQPGAGSTFYFTLPAARRKRAPGGEDKKE